MPFDPSPLPLTQVTFWAPSAAGAGVSLVMAYLNGNHIPNLLRLRTLVTKVVGTTCAVASGLAVGPEGPLIHIGACIASNIANADCSARRGARGSASAGPRCAASLSRALLAARAAAAGLCVRGRRSVALSTPEGAGA